MIVYHFLFVINKELPEIAAAHFALMRYIADIYHPYILRDRCSDKIWQHMNEWFSSPGLTEARMPQYEVNDK